MVYGYLGHLLEVDGGVVDGRISVCEYGGHWGDGSFEDGGHNAIRIGCKERTRTRREQLKKSSGRRRNVFLYPSVILVPSQL
jgi:hypothetical protein